MSDDSIQKAREADFQRFKKYAAMGFLVISPILIAIPPRRLDHFTVLHISAFAVSANYITRERTGRSIMERIIPQSNGLNVLNELPSERAREIQERLRAAREARIREEGIEKEELEKVKARQRQEKGVLERVWMGNEEAGWKERRLLEEQKALDEGKGYGDMIKEHIWEVWNWGDDKKKTEEGKKDE
ncbi:hypothetical protein BJY01DRAFT_228885 [Aspergillus pseudoustus]|uniref:Rhomboid family membrane protein n=1 Tax=Aspergillus pseudoustus TaxID=1810923 RepID=A0ABR4IJE3_9EURO